MFDFFALYLAFSFLVHWVRRKTIAPAPITLAMGFLLFLGVLGFSAVKAREGKPSFCASQVVDSLSDPKRRVDEKFSSAQEGKSLLESLSQKNLGLRCLRPLVLHPQAELQARSNGYRRGATIAYLGGKQFEQMETVEGNKFYPIEINYRGLSESNWIKFPSQVKTKRDLWEYLGLISREEKIVDFSYEEFFEDAANENPLKGLAALGVRVAKSIVYTPFKWTKSEASYFPMAWYQTKYFNTLDSAYLFFLLANMLFLLWVLMVGEYFYPLRTLSSFLVLAFALAWQWMGILV